jgi:hypothetical protein
LASRRNPRETTSTGKELVALRTWRGDDGKVFKVDAFDAAGVAEAAARPTLMSCGRGLELARPPEPEKPEEKKQEPAGGGGQ